MEKLKNATVEQPVTKVFVPTLTKEFDHLEMLLSLCRPKKLIKVGSLAVL